MPPVDFLQSSSLESFWHVHNLIHVDPIFVSTCNHPQHPVYYQLATFLCCLGAKSGLKTAGVMSIAKGSVAHLAWPGGQRRQFLSGEMADWGFPGCIGIADDNGSYIHLENKPTENGFAYWCCKKFYAATCDHQAIFTSYDFGWPGSVQDSQAAYFWQHEYILVDKGTLLRNLCCDVLT
ncbi:uncharacterized protein BJ212DRAFT_1448307 [Suillus subaureus]|uniref:DDE Tnp4 domain-containing protein n=1 Tax=Suillus subaureus TaxID=48587 RepID=A0A9P7JAV9_9AGAM|nr:uncharacterized protein BJ212DRAFT_1448307 [Suillus subaureus]KAG1811730.1 hypothetical protein BJ212DRAFT_1448307 [Suillus subaureus]